MYHQEYNGKYVGNWEITVKTRGAVRRWRSVLLLHHSCNAVHNIILFVV